MYDRERWEEISNMIGDTVIDRAQHRIGKVRDVAQVADTMEPGWLVVKTSRFGRQRLVPIESAVVHGDVVEVPFSKKAVLEAPVPVVPVTVAGSERDELIRYYRPRNVQPRRTHTETLTTATRPLGPSIVGASAMTSLLNWSSGLPRPRPTCLPSRFQMRVESLGVPVEV